MENMLFSSVRLLTKLLGCFFITTWFLSTTSCNNTVSIKQFPQDSVRQWLNWNLFFGKTADGASRERIKRSIEDSLTAFAKRIDKTVKVKFEWNSCPCDPSLANLDGRLIGGSGDAVTTPPTQPQPGASGDYVIHENIKIDIPEALHQNQFDSTKKLQLNGISSNGQAMLNGQVLAVIDTGLDTLAFQPSIRNLLWKDPSGTTLFDFLLPNALGNLSDDNHVKHGTAATALALEEFIKPAKPQVMALKSFDARGHGNIYSVSCALSYAIKNKATLINASWGYYGEPDPVLYSYIKRADSLHIPIIAAAGNSTEPHPPALCRDAVNTVNKLQGNHLFYPACFSASVPNLLAVTGLNRNSNNLLQPCYYQNYSERFVSVGVANKDSCCQYGLPFLPWPIEGTSFATPVVSGRYLFMLQTTTPGPGNAHSFLETFTQRTTGSIYTVNGNYIVHVP